MSSQERQPEVSRRNLLKVGTGLLIGASLNRLNPPKASADTLPMEVRLPTTDGRTAVFYRETIGDTANPNSIKGYMADADMETALEQQGGIQTIGYPISRSYKDNLGRETQIFQKEELQLTHDASGKVIKVEDGNTLDGLEDRLKASGKNIDLNAAPYYLPPSFDWSSDSGKTWNQTIQNHFDKVFGHPEPESPIDLLQKAYKSNPDWLNLNGLPMSIGTYNNGGLIVVRGQRGAEQYWRDPTPWTDNQPGGIVRNNAGDLLKELRLIDPAVAQPEDFPVGGGGQQSPEQNAQNPVEAYLATTQTTDSLSATRNGKTYSTEFRINPNSPYRIVVDPGMREKLANIVAQEGEKHGYSKVTILTVSGNPDALNYAGNTFYKPASLTGLGYNGNGDGFIGSMQIGDRAVYVYIAGDPAPGATPALAQELREKFARDLRNQDFLINGVDADINGYFERLLINPRDMFSTVTSDQAKELQTIPHDVGNVAADYGLSLSF